MCYSAQVEADYRQYVRRFGATLSLQDFFDTFWRRAQGENLKCPKAMEAAFQDSEDEALAPIRALIAQHHQQQASRWEQELFKQRKRLADAERTLQQRQTRKALDDQRIATQKVSQLMGWLADLRRRTPDAARDHRIYPGQHVPVMVWEDGRRVVKPMRYHCRPAGKPAFFDQKYPGLYNARRDNLQGFWKGQFGHTHGVVLVRRFYENVARHQAEGRELAPGEVAQNVVLAFEPTPPQDLLLACLWSRWQGPDGESLLSFAVITDEPPPEVAATGHDRCPIPIQPANIDAWLRPDPQRLADQQALLDDRPPLVFAHQLAA